MKGQGKRLKPDLAKNIASITEPSHSPLFPGEKISKKKQKKLTVNDSPEWCENVERKSKSKKVSVADSPTTRKMKEAPKKFENEKQVSKSKELR